MGSNNSDDGDSRFRISLFQRIGDSVSPREELVLNITPELQAEHLVSRP
jgi:hypothetical protein